MWENKVFGNKKNTWENLQIDIEIKTKNQFPKDSLFFEFFNTLKQIKIVLKPTRLKDFDDG